MSAASRFDALRLLKALSLSMGTSPFTSAETGDRKGNEESRNPGIGACWNSSGANQIKAIKVILAVLAAEGLAAGPTGSNPIKVICRNRRGSAVSMSAASRFDALRLLKALSLSMGTSPFTSPEIGDRKGNEEPRLGETSTAQRGQRRNSGIGACWNSSGANQIKAIKVILPVLTAEGLAVGPTRSNQIQVIKVVLPVLMAEGLAVDPTGSNQIKAIKVILAVLTTEGLAAGPTGSNQIKAIKVILAVLAVEGLAPGPTGSNQIKAIWRLPASSLG